MKRASGRTGTGHEPTDGAFGAVRLAAFDFDGVFTDNGVYVFEDGSEAVRCDRGDGLGIGMLRDAGVAIVVISKERNPVVAARCRKLDIPCIQACDEKRRTLEEFAAGLGIPLSAAAFVGNDVNDIPCMDAVALPVAVADAHPAVIPHARYRTRAKGGRGAVREVCDLLIAARNRRQPR